MSESRKILTVGANSPIVLNDKLVSVKGDYPFWKVNADTSEQYWNKFDATNTSEGYEIDIETVGTFTGTSFLGWVTTDGVIYYSIPSNDTAIKKFNTETGVLTYIGNISGSGKYTSGVVVSHFIYYIPLNATAILKYNTLNDTFEFLGNLTGSNKFGKGILLPNGKIFAPKNTATSHLEIDTTNDDEITLIPATNVSASDTFEAGTWYWDGYVYGIRGADSNSGRIVKMDINDDYSEEIITVMQGGTSLWNNIAVYRNSTFVFGFNSANCTVFNNDTNVVSTIALGSTNIRAVKYGGDGWLYILSNTNNSENKRLNPKNFTIETVSVNGSTGNNFYLNGVISGLNGKIFAFNNTGLQIHLLNPNTPNQNLNPNQLLNRNINKI